MKKALGAVATLVLVATIMLLGGCPGSDSGSTDTADASVGDPSLIGDGISVARVSINNQPSPSVHIIVPFTKVVPGLNFVNVVIDLNNDGTWVDYTLGDGTVQSEWVVRNMPAIIKPSEPNGFHFRITDFNADKRTNLKLRAIVTPAPINTASFPNGWDGTVPSTAVATKNLVVGNFTVENLAVSFDLNGGIGGISASVLSGPLQKLASFGISTAIAQDQGATQTRSVFHDNVPDLKQPAGSLECVPTASANSFLWLASQANKGFEDMSKDGATLINELKGDTKWGEKTGVTSENVVPGKQAFINRHHLPVDTHQVGDVNDQGIFDKIYAELDKGQDVEISILFTEADPNNRQNTRVSRHMVTVVGATDAGGSQSLTIRNPLGTPGVESYDLSVHPDTKKLWLPMWEPWGGTIEYAFADSPVSQTAAPPPSTATPPPSPSVLVNPVTLNIVHIMGTSPCPTHVGSFFIGESAPGTLNWSISGVTPWLTLSSTSGTISSTANAFEISVDFNCNVPSKGTYSATLTVTGKDTSGNVTGTQNVTVTVVVS